MKKYLTIFTLIFALNSMQLSLFAQGNYTVSNPCLNNKPAELITT
jgi:hypothetical protein